MELGTFVGGTIDPPGPVMKVMGYKSLLGKLL